MTLADLLEGVAAGHRAAFPDGDWRGANEALGKLRVTADAEICKAGLWPRDRRFIGNDMAVALLRQIKVEP